ncbi:MAG: membrane protein insertion efficiency factor YidD [Clostridiales bacterium]|nr:membrane protein insertion efficiency factor YidD [Clostridiales bacterium]
MGKASFPQKEFKTARKCLLRLLNFYQQYVSGCLPSACRFSPTCSEYMREAIEKYGARKGLFLGIKRILRCNPFCKCGYDPVP